ncbi:Domain of unknown function (DUF303) [Seminavis robusta]|uniref:Sialate O-acetylesterase domain-containing protein n=1 Tax=Seminavis robusta TaxID=568900 RepID=A0A9N8ELW5_9STRA|nr:Domain of unknown function (DUF303) [Seminavis robusta]|eukprot:Sro1334_g263760.1 Domain of unknown function (DUF303) (327) ;mRNA; r:6498-7478
MTETEEEPVQVFIMMGQSNMLGFGDVGQGDKPGTLEYIYQKEGRYQELKKEDGSWFQSDNVRYAFAMARNGRTELQKNEWLTVNQRHKFGPELGFGKVLGAYYGTNAPNKKVLLLKVCIGNRSLGWDLLPPGSPRFEGQDGKIYAGYKDSPGDWAKDSTPEPVKWYGGKQYDMDVSTAKELLADLGKYAPGATKYEIAGFVFWQGHKDSYNKDHTLKYEENLVRLIHILRRDFDAPDAKFVLATVGFDGDNMKGNMLDIANAQLAVSGETGKYPYFEGNVKTIDARPFWRSKEQSPTGQGHHYNQNGETFYEVGKALGEAMVELLQ